MLPDIFGLEMKRVQVVLVYFLKNGLKRFLT